jgi:hypothetical protein
MIALPKILVIILLAIGAWYAMRWLNKPGGPVARRREAPAGGPRPQPDPRFIGEAEDLVACRACGSYVAASARNCGKAGCPYPR